MHYDFWARSAGKRYRAVRCNLYPALKAGKGFPLPSLARTLSAFIHPYIEERSCLYSAKQDVNERTVSSVQKISLSFRRSRWRNSTPESGNRNSKYEFHIMFYGLEIVYLSSKHNFLRSRFKCCFNA
jgi:hypothetical protein